MITVTNLDGRILACLDWCVKHLILPFKTALHGRFPLRRLVIDDVRKAVLDGDRREIRTLDPLLRRQLLYPLNYAVKVPLLNPNDRVYFNLRRMAFTISNRSLVHSFRWITALWENIRKKPKCDYRANSLLRAVWGGGSFYTCEPAEASSAMLN